MTAASIPASVETIGRTELQRSSAGASESAGVVFLSTMPAGRGDRRLALAAVLVSVAVFFAAAPFAKVQLPEVWAFLPAYQSALTLNDTITAVLLFGQFSILRSRAMLMLGAGYLFSALMAIAHALSFPDLFAPGGLLGGGPQTTAWLYFLWHGGFPLFVIAYALLGDQARPTNRTGEKVGGVFLCAIGAVVALAGGCVLVTTAGHDLLPALMQGNLDDSGKLRVATATWLLSLLALPAIWRRRPHSVLDLWLIVVLCAWIFDVALASVLNHGRFDVGWYAGRVYGLLAASFVLALLLTENSVLYGRLIKAHGDERREHLLAEQQAAELAAVNRDLEAFSYSVSHDLRAPLRGIDGFSRILEEDHADALGPDGRDCTARIRRAAQRMGDLIDDLLRLSRIARTEVRHSRVDLGALARDIAAGLREQAPERNVEIAIADGLDAQGDPGLLRIALENLLGNSWKFTAERSPARIEVGREVVAGEGVYCVRDNGAGFDMAFAGKLFGAFQRLHSGSAFPGSGIGLTIVKRVIEKHGGRIWAEAEDGKGAAFFFTLPESGGREPTAAA